MEHETRINNHNQKASELRVRNGQNIFNFLLIIYLIHPFFL